MQRATIFINASSGWDAKEDAPGKLQEWFEAAGVRTEIQGVQAGVNLAERAREAVAAGVDLVVAGGGDGTLSATASGLVGTDVIFGVLPVGTLNHFARDLGIPLELKEAARVVLAGRTDYVDVGEVNGKTFLNNSIIGLYPVFRFLRADKERKGWNRKLALLLAALDVFRRYPSFLVRFHADGREMVRRTPYILIANNEHAMEGYQLGARRSMTEGKLWIYVLPRRGRLRLLGMLFDVLLGRFDARRDFEIFSATELWVETKSKRIGVALDGEVTVMATPLHYRILPRSLRVLKP
jgi:YegS/Rv2252/BmrU family lipid kinase